MMTGASVGGLVSSAAIIAGFADGRRERRRVAGSAGERGAIRSGCGRKRISNKWSRAYTHSVEKTVETDSAWCLRKSEL